MADVQVLLGMAGTEYSVSPGHRTPSHTVCTPRPGSLRPAQGQLRKHPKEGATHDSRLVATRALSLVEPLRYAYGTLLSKVTHFDVDPFQSKERLSLKKS